LFEEAGVDRESGGEDACLRFLEESAVHHLFLVAAGLDSAVLGEDQILGQVKEAYFLAQEQGCCKKEFHSLFRLAITAAKKVKTDTPLSKTSVSTASLALKQVQKDLGSLAGKNIMVIGASGKIGGIFVKDALDCKGVRLFVTVRHGLPHDLRKRQGEFQEIAYQDRYQWMDDMDVIVSATSSPHYTVTKQHYLEHCCQEKQKILIDLALPQDIEESLTEIPSVRYYSMEEMKCLARENNNRKKSFVPAAQKILWEYEQDYEKERLFGKNREFLDCLKGELIRENQTKSLEQVWDHFFFSMKEKGSAEEYGSFLAIVRRMVEKSA
jgi:glutamyl-tRNA reductase